MKRVALISFIMSLFLFLSHHVHGEILIQGEKEVISSYRYDIYSYSYYTGGSNPMWKSDFFMLSTGKLNFGLWSIISRNEYWSAPDNGDKFRHLRYIFPFGVSIPIKTRKDIYSLRIDSNFYLFPIKEEYIVIDYYGYNYEYPRILDLGLRFDTWMASLSVGYRQQFGRWQKEILHWDDGHVLKTENLGNFTGFFAGANIGIMFPSFNQKIKKYVIEVPKNEKGIQMLAGIIEEPEKYTTISNAAKIQKESLEALVLIGAPAFNELTNIAKDNKKDVWLRTKSIKSLGLIEGAEPIQPLFDIVLNDNRFDIQKAALSALIDIGNPAGNALIEIAKDRAINVNLRLIAIKALGDIKLANSSQALFNIVMSNEIMSIKKASISALGIIAGPANDTLIKIAEDTVVNKELRLIAIEALGNMNDDAAIQSLLGIAISDKSLDLQKSAINALRKIGNPASNAFISIIKDDTKNLQLRLLALESMENIGYDENTGLILEPLYFQKAKHINTEESYLDFLAKYPQSNFIEEAMRLRWKIALSSRNLGKCVKCLRDIKNEELLDEFIQQFQKTMPVTIAPDRKIILSAREINMLDKINAGLSGWIFSGDDLSGLPFVPTYEIREAKPEHTFLNVLMLIGNYGEEFEIKRDEIKVSLQDGKTYTPLLWDLPLNRSIPGTLIEIHTQTDEGNDSTLVGESTIINLIFEVPKAKLEEFSLEIAGLKIDSLSKIPISVTP